MGKRFVSIVAEYSNSGRVTPLQLLWPDGRVFSVDYVNEVQRAASQIAGGFGMRYDCMIHGKRVFLFKDGDLWFMETTE